MHDIDQLLPMRPGVIKEFVDKANKIGPKGEDSSDNSEHESKNGYNPIIFREICQYCILTNPVLGTLTLTRESLTFEPDTRDATVDERGFGHYQVHIDIENILECGCIGGSSKELMDSTDNMRCDGFLQVIVRNANYFPDSENSPSTSDSIIHSPCEKDPRTSEKATESSSGARHLKSHKSLLFAGLTKLGSVVSLAISQDISKFRPRIQRSKSETPYISVLFGFFTKENAHRCTLLLMDTIDHIKERKILNSGRNGITSIPFSSNSLIERWVCVNDEPQSLSNEKSIVAKEERFRDLQYCEQIAKRSSVLSPGMVEQLIDVLPPSLAIREWILSFEINHDGISFSTFYKNLENSEHCIILVQDTNDAIFGVFTGAISPCYKFYGTAETFVFKFTRGDIKVFKSKGVNRCYIYTSEESIVVGGGKDSAFSIGEGFSTGTSGESDTFGNEILASSCVFHVKLIEVWTFGSFAP